MTIFEESLALHEQHHGKIGIAGKVALNNKKDLSLAYTPGVAAVCEAIAADPASAARYTIKANTIAVISDGSAILGLGNLGAAAAIPVMEGKALLFKEFAGLDAFPICLDTQDAEEIIKTVIYLAPVFGGINLEDIAAPKCFEIERRLRLELSIPVVHDDQHGTAVVVLAALINALKVKGIAAKGVRVVVNGAGAAGTAVAELLVRYGIRNIVVCDSKGIISQGRSDLNSAKTTLCAHTNPDNISGSLTDALREADVFIGLSVAGALTSDMVHVMSPGPIIFAMANPMPEIQPEEARAAGALVIATGRSDLPNQINNVLAFPGIFRGAFDNHVTLITDDMFVEAAKNLAACVKNPTADKIIPDVFDKSVVSAVAAAIK